MSNAGCRGDLGLGGDEDALLLCCLARLGASPSLDPHKDDRPDLLKTCFPPLLTNRSVRLVYPCLSCEGTEAREDERERRDRGDMRGVGGLVGDGLDVPDEEDADGRLGDMDVEDGGVNVKKQQAHTLRV